MSNILKERVKCIFYLFTRHSAPVRNGDKNKQFLPPAQFANRVVFMAADKSTSVGICRNLIR